MLLPREHGAYGQLAFPLATALAIGRPASGAFALAAAGVAVFLGHESLLVLLGQRGGRAAREQRAEARRSLAIFGLAAVMTGGLATLRLSPSARVAVLVPVCLTAVLAVVVATGKERTTAGEMLVAITLSSLSIPTAIGSGAPWQSALAVALVFCVVFVSATMAVRAIIARTTRSGPPRTVAASVILGAILLLVLSGAVGVIRPVAAFAALPASGVLLWLLARPPAPRHLRVVGWTLVAATAATAVILVVVL